MFEGLGTQLLQLLGQAQDAGRVVVIGPVPKAFEVLSGNRYAGVALDSLDLVFQGEERETQVISGDVGQGQDGVESDHFVFQSVCVQVERQQ